MPRAEAGTTKAIANSMKSKGLQRLRWYCQVCEKQCRDDNGFKCHVASESHVKRMHEVGENPMRVINDYSNQFKRDFIQLLRTGHGEKKINANRFYQEYISNKTHVHQSATRWKSLTEFIRYLGQEGIVKVYEDEKATENNQSGAAGLMISWIDNSPEALRRQDALKKKERQDRGDEHREQREIEKQIRKARAQAAGGVEVDEEHEEDDEVQSAVDGGIKRADREKISLSFGAKKQDEPVKPPSPPPTENSSSPEREANKGSETPTSQPTPPEQQEEPAAKVSLKPISLAGPSKPKNVFAAAGKKSAFNTVKKPAPVQQPRPMSEAERIMKEELERKRRIEERGAPHTKRQRVF